MSDESVQPFGIVDVVEAFTAMRHDLKLQSKEGRKLVEAVEQAVSRIEQIAEQTKSPATEVPSSADASVCKAFADALAEVDETVQRTVEAATMWIGTRARTAGDSTGSCAETIERIYDQQPAWVRWAAKDLRQQLLAATSTPQEPPDEGLDASLEGLRLMQQRVRKLTDNCQVRRVDVLGKLFDPNQMNALEAVPLESVSQPSGVFTDEQASEPRRSGEVIEQLRPAYYWNGTLLRYAQVRIAR